MVDRFDLSGKRALITGGGRGLGREMAQAFAEHGADVIIASRKLDVLEQTAAEIAEATGFANAGHFSNAYKAAFGIRPQTDRRQSP